MNNQKKLGVSLSGGAIRAVAHLGFLSRLIEEGLTPSKISGVSGGAIIAAFVCDGYTPKETLSIFKEYQISRFFSPTWAPGLMSMSRLHKAVKKHIRTTTFEEFKIPLYIYATNLNTEKLATFHSGDILNPLIASCSIPVLFKPVMIDSNSYVDGGVIDNLPIKDLKDCDVTIGINVNPRIGEKSISNMMSVAMRVFKLITYSHSTYHKNEFDYYMCPKDLKNYKLFDGRKIDEIFHIGEQSADSHMDQIKKSMQ